MSKYANATGYTDVTTNGNTSNVVLFGAGASAFGSGVRPKNPL